MFHLSSIENVTSAIILLIITVFQDRFATTRATPSIDEHRDWVLEHGEEEGGFTILQFERKWPTAR